MYYVIVQNLKLSNYEEKFKTKKRKYKCYIVDNVFSPEFRTDLLNNLLIDKPNLNDIFIHFINDDTYYNIDDYGEIEITKNQLSNNYCFQHFKLNGYSFEYYKD